MKVITTIIRVVETLLAILHVIKPMIKEKEQSNNQSANESEREHSESDDNDSTKIETANLDLIKGGKILEKSSANAK